MKIGSYFVINQWEPRLFNHRLKIKRILRLHSLGGLQVHVRIELWAQIILEKTKGFHILSFCFPSNNLRQIELSHLSRFSPISAIFKTPSSELKLVARASDIIKLNHMNPGSRLSKKKKKKIKAFIMLKFLMPIFC